MILEHIHEDLRDSFKRECQELEVIKEMIDPNRDTMRKVSIICPILQLYFSLPLSLPPPQGGVLCALRTRIMYT
jgi:hypothetical protein